MLVAYENLMIAFDLMKQGDTRTATPHGAEEQSHWRRLLGCPARGYLTHHLEMDKGALVNYQVVTPSTWNASPKDPFGNGGPYEEAVVNTPILEEFDKQENFTASTSSGAALVRPVHALHHAHLRRRPGHHPRSEHLRVRH